MLPLSAEAIQHLDRIARASEAPTQQIVSENQHKTGEKAQTAQEFVQDQLAEGRGSLIAQEGTNQKAFNYLRDKECRIPRGKGIIETVNDCVPIKGGFIYAKTNEDTSTIDFVVILNGKTFTDARLVNGRPNSQSNIDLVNTVIGNIARMGDFKSV